MKKFGKMRIAAAIALVAALLGSATASAVGGVTAESATPTGFETQAVEITGGNEALSGWQYYFYNETIKTYYQSNELFVRATKDGRTGNALEIERKKVGDELWIYSYSFAVESGTNYEISSFVKIADASGKLVYCIKEIDENGNDVTDSTILSQTQYIDRHSVSGVLSDWTETSFTRTTEAATKKIVLRIRAEGTGIINIDDLTVKKVIAPNTNMFKMIGVGNGLAEDTKPKTMPVLSEVNLSSDSSDGDGKSLKLNHNDVYRTVFGILPHGKTYRLSFKYKNTAGGTADGLGIRLDNVTTSGERVWYAAPVNSTEGKPDTEWQTYNYDFTAVAGQTDICWMAITATGGYLIDELSITGTDEDGATMQYIVNGSFSGAYLEGYTYGGNYNVAKQTDGTYVFASSAVTKDSGSESRGYLRLDTSRLEQGKTYTLGFDYRSGGSQAVTILYGTYWQDQISLGDCGQSTIAGWTSKSFEFVAGTQVTDRGDNTVRSATTIEIYGDAGISWPTYFKNISIKDAAGNEFIENKTLVAPDGSTYTSDFGTGDTEYTWNDWNIVNGGIYGFTFEDGNKDYKVCLNGSADNAATAITKEIDVTGKNIVSVDKQIYYTADSSFGSNLAVTVLAGNNEISANEKGYFVLPEGTESIRVKFSANEFVTFKKVYVNAHAHGEDCANVGGEQYNAYAFASDNLSCTATRYYACGGVAKTETVETVFGGDSATFTETGKATYTAVFKDEDFDTQTVTVETPMKSSPEVKMIKNGASVRTSEPYGIRWAAGIRTADWNKLVEVYGENNVKAGVIVAPLDYVKQADEFTISAFNEASLKYADIVSDTFNAEVNAMAEGYSGFYASLVNIQAGNLNRKFAARAYVAVEKDGVVTYYYGEYSAENQARSIYEVSKSAVASSTEKEAVKEFAKGVLNKVIDVTVENGNAVLTEIAGYASPYAVSLSGNVLTITAADGADINNVKIVCVNGKNYKPTVSGNAVTVSID